MSSPPLSATPESLGARRFSFAPPIVNITHNEWEFRQSTWSEVLVANIATHQEIWISRRLLGAVTSADDPVVTVELRKELEYKAGTVWAIEKHVPADPASPPAPVPVPAPAAETPSAPPAHVKAAQSSESRVAWLIGGVMAGAIVLFVLVVAAMHLAPANPRVVFTTRDQGFLDLDARDDYFSVVRKLGAPAADRWRSEQGELQYRALWYPQRGFYIVLMGTDRKDIRYIGALDKQWHVAHYVELSRGHTTAAMMRSIPKF